MPTLKKYKVVVIEEKSTEHVVEAPNASAALNKAINSSAAVDVDAIRLIELMPDDTEVTIK